MLDALSLTWRSIKDTWEDFAFLAMLNFLWAASVALVAAPVLVLRNASPLVAWGLAALCALPLPVISGGLCYVANQITRGVAVKLATFVEGIRRYWAKSLVVALLNIAVLALIGANLRFYGWVLEGTWTNFALSAWLVLGIFWLLAQIYWFPMIFELKNEKVFVALRHALAMVIIGPGFSLSIGVVLVLLAALSIVLTVPAAFFLAALVLLVCNHATRSRLARIQKKRYRPGAGPE